MHGSIIGLKISYRQTITKVFQRANLMVMPHKEAHQLKASKLGFKSIYYFKIFYQTFGAIVASLT
jgi:hypothetical protein